MSIKKTLLLKKFLKKMGFFAFFALSRIFQGKNREKTCPAHIFRTKNATVPFPSEAYAHTRTHIL